MANHNPTKVTNSLLKAKVSDPNRQEYRIRTTLKIQAIQIIRFLNIVISAPFALPKQLFRCGTNILQAATTGGVAAIMALMHTSSIRRINRLTSLPCTPKINNKIVLSVHVKKNTNLGSKIFEESRQGPFVTNIFHTWVFRTVKENSDIYDCVL